MSVLEAAALPAMVEDVRCWELVEEERWVLDVCRCREGGFEVVVYLCTHSFKSVGVWLMSSSSEALSACLVPLADCNTPTNVIQQTTTTLFDELYNC